MLKPTYRFFVIPLGAIVTLASLSSQTPSPRTQHGSPATQVREQVIDCTAKSPTEVCVLSIETAR